MSKALFNKSSRDIKSKNLLENKVIFDCGIKGALKHLLLKHPLLKVWGKKSGIKLCIGEYRFGSINMYKDYFFLNIKSVVINLHFSF